MKKRVLRIIKTIAIYALLAIFLFPFFLVMINSLKRKASIIKFPLSLKDSEGFQWVNYATAVKKMDFVKAFTNSITETTASIIIMLILSAMMAYYFARNKNKVSKICFSTLLASMILPFQVVMIPLISIYGAKLHIINSLPTLVIMNVGFGLSLCTFMFHGFIKTNIPISLEESAILDGCTPLKAFGSIVLPLLKPIISTITILEILSLWNDFLLPSLVLRRKNLYTLPVAIRTFYGEFSNDYGYIMAGLVLSILPVIIAYLFFQKSIIGGVVEGAVKS